MNLSQSKLNLVTKSLIIAAFGMGLSACQTSLEQSNSPVAKRVAPTSMFTESFGILPTENRGRRKWDGAIVGDLDGNGFQDLILTEHAYRVRIFWNEGGHFTGPQDLVSGDMHGLSIADLDNDGLMDILIAQGGGNGGNPKMPMHYEVTRDREFIGGDVLTHFEKGRGRSVKALDADSDGVLELFLTGFPTPEQFKKGANHFYTNDGKGNFSFNAHLPFGQRLSYRSSITDFNDDGDPDILVFGGHDFIAIQGEEGVAFKEVTKTVLGDLTKINDISAISQFDYDADGDLDLIVSRAEHQFEHETYYDDENKRFAFFARFKPLQVEDLTIEGDFKLENLQMAFPHFNVYVGEDKRKLELDTKAVIPSFDWDREGPNSLSLSAKEANGFPQNVCVKGIEVKNLPKDSKPGLYVGHVGKGVWRICSQTSSPTAGVVHNVISKHQSHQDQPLPAILLENDNGVYKNVTAAMGININEQTSSVVAADFDNDGWQDILVSRYGNMATQNEQILYLNKQGKSFERVQSHGAFSKDLGATGSGVESIDYDKDGDLDLITANERGRWHLYTNNSESLNNNNFIGVTVKQSPSGNATAFGAKATVKACNRTQSRTVGNTSSSFAVTHNNDLLFGLGSCEKIDSIHVHWTNGEVVEVTDKSLNQYVTSNKT